MRKRRYTGDPVKRVYAKLLGKDHINVWVCSCGYKWDRIDDTPLPWMVCPGCGKSHNIRKIQQVQI